MFMIEASGDSSAAAFYFAEARVTRYYTVPVAAGAMESAGLEWFAVEPEVPQCFGLE